MPFFSFRKMKRTASLILALVAAAVLSANASAQLLSGVRFGVTGAYTTSNHTLRGFDTEKVGKYNVGVALQIPLVNGFVIQPSVVYQVKGNDLGSAALESHELAGYLETKPGFIEIPVQVQWGPDLMFFRPYVFAEPFIGWRMTKDKGKSATGAVMSDTEYGLGLGVGLELGIFQISYRYYWNWGDLYDANNVSDATIQTAVRGGDNYSGSKIALVVFL